MSELERISARVHDQWMQSKIAQGVTSRKSESGEELMVPYDQLSEAAKELDRGSVRAVLAVMDYDEIRAERDRLKALINTPETVDFVKAVQLEAAHQRERWPSKQDSGKTVADWFWLLGYLGGKAMFNLQAGNNEKGLHHIITTAAACANWHHQLTVGNDMRPGIEEPK